VAELKQLIADELEVLLLDQQQQQQGGGAVAAPSRFRTRHVRKRGSASSGISYILSNARVSVGDLLRNEEEILAEMMMAE